MLTRSVGVGMEVVEGEADGQVEIHQIDPAAISPGEFADMVRATTWDTIEHESGLARADL